MNEFIANILKRIANNLEKSSLDNSIESSQLKNFVEKKVNSKLSLVFVFLVVFLLYWVSIVAIWASFYDRYITASSLSWIGFYYGHISAIVFVLLQTFLLVNIILAVRKNNCKIFSYFYLIYLPFYFSLFLIPSEILKEMNKELNYFNIILIGLIWFYPLIHILKTYFRKLDWKNINRVKNFFLMFNLGFFFLLSINTALVTIWFRLDIVQPWTTGLISLLRDSQHSFWLFEWLLYLIACFIFITTWIFSLNIYFNEAGKSRKSLHRWILILILVFWISLIPSFMDNFYTYQINKAQSILNSEWQNYEWFKDAKVFLLERAFYSKIKNGEYINIDLFQKIFDSTPEEYFWESIADYTDSRSTFATNSSKVWDKAKVLLSLAEIENRVSSWSVFQVLETTYRFNFTNTSITNEEVIINFETPSKNSVVAGLKLGLNLELIWQIAPRWAARQVYEDSLRKNIDPALIEKIWLNTYNLRVFPIPSKLDTNSQWRQIVEVKMLTPILQNNEKLTYSPKFSFINLKFNKDSGLKSKIYNEWKLIKEDTAQNDEIEKYLTKEHVLEFDSKTDSSLWDYCLNDYIYDILDKSHAKFSTWILNLDKISLFLDNSLSIERSASNSFYEAIESKLKNHWNSLNDMDLYSYNFAVNKLLSAKDIKYFWYSDVESIIDYIISNNIVNQRIVLVTDDSSYNYSTIENKTRDYSSLLTNQISIIKIGKKVKTYKQEINNILSATSGNIYEVNTSEDIDSAINKIFDTKNIRTQSGKCIESDSDDNFDKVQAWYISNLLLSNIRNDSDWQIIAELQTALAQKYSIINQFNSLIALATPEQQKSLEQYSQSYNKYESFYNNNDWGVNNWNSFGSMRNNEKDDFSLPSRDVEFMNSDNNISGPSWKIYFWQDRVNKSLAWDDSTYRWIYWSSGWMEFDWRINLNFFWLLMLLIYLTELYGIIGFIINYKKWTTKEDNNKTEL